MGPCALVLPGPGDVRVKGARGLSKLCIASPFAKAEPYFQGERAKDPPVSIARISQGRTHFTLAPPARLHHTNISSTWLLALLHCSNTLQRQSASWDDKELTGSSR